MPQNQSQNQNVIKNPKSANEPQTKGPEMNDRDFMNDMLATEKYLTDSLNVFAREASHQSLHTDVMQMLTESHQCQRDFFNLMFELGHYKLEAEEQQKLDQAHTQFQNYSTQFPYPTNGMVQ